MLPHPHPLAPVMMLSNPLSSGPVMLFVSNPLSSVKPTMLHNISHISMAGYVSASPLSSAQVLVNNPVVLLGKPLSSVNPLMLHSISIITMAVWQRNNFAVHCHQDHW